MLEHKFPSQVTGRRSSPRPRPSPKSSPKAAKPVRGMKRCFSEPIVLTGSEDCLSWRSCSVLELPTCREAFLSTPLFTGYPHSLEGYNRDAKVVITVTVEGSPGPIRGMVKLGFSVEKTIEFVLDRYGKEGRTPKLEKNVSCYDLHPSYFSIQCLDKSQLIGDIGCRSFYLRKSNSSSHSNPGESASHTSLKASDGTPLPPQFFLMSPLFATRFERRVRKLWRFLVCLQ